MEPGRTINVLISNPERKKERTDQDANDRELHVAGLGKNTTKQDLEKVFTKVRSVYIYFFACLTHISKFGPVKDIRMAMDNDGKFRAFAFVEFENEVGDSVFSTTRTALIIPFFKIDARAGLDANNQELKGRRMAITVADSRSKPKQR